MNSLRRKPEFIIIPAEWAAVVRRNIRRSMRNDDEIIQRWERRQERQRIQKEIVKSEIVNNQRKM